MEKAKRAQLNTAKEGGRRHLDEEIYQLDGEERDPHSEQPQRPADIRDRNQCSG
jgi:hypothetical protein